MSYRIVEKPRFAARYPSIFADPLEARVLRDAGHAGFVGSPDGQFKFIDVGMARRAARARVLRDFQEVD